MAGFITVRGFLPPLPQEKVHRTLLKHQSPCDFALSMLPSDILPVYFSRPPLEPFGQFIPGSNCGQSLGRHRPYNSFSESRRAGHSDESSHNYCSDHDCAAALRLFGRTSVCCRPEKDRGFCDSHGWHLDSIGCCPLDHPGNPVLLFDCCSGCVLGLGLSACRCRERHCCCPRSPLVRSPWIHQRI